MGTYSEVFSWKDFAGTANNNEAAVFAESVRYCLSRCCLSVERCRVGAGLWSGPHLLNTKPGAVQPQQVLPNLVWAGLNDIPQAHRSRFLGLESVCSTPDSGHHCVSQITAALTLPAHAVHQRGRVTRSFLIMGG